MKNKILNKCEKLLDKGIMVPKTDMIKNLYDIEKIKEAGELNNKVLDYAIANLKPMMTTHELDVLVREFTIKNGGYPAPLETDFMHSCCISINSCVAHGVPSTRVLINEGDLVKIDCTTKLNGYYADACRSVVVGNNDEAQRLVDINERIMNEVISKIIPYESYIGDIGYYINEEAKKYGLGVVVELGGHGVGLEFHEEPFIDNIANKGENYLITPGMVFTIEPIFTEGSPKVKEFAGGIYTLDNSLSTQIEYTIAVLEDGIQIVTK